MICDVLPSLIGLDCFPVSESGDIARIESPFVFDDGDTVPIFVQSTGGQVRFFDDGGILFHFLGRGLSFEDGRRSRPLRAAAEENGAQFNDCGELEIWSAAHEAPTAFARYVATIVQIAAWEKDQRGLGMDATLLIEEVAMCFRAWKPDAELVDDPEYEGVSGRSYRLDFKFDGQGVLATSPHPIAVNAAIKKLLDIRSGSQNQRLGLLVIIDDRIESVAKDALVIGALASVLPFTKLEANARRSSGGGTLLRN